MPCVAEVQTWHEAAGKLMAQVETLRLRLKNLGGALSSLGFHALPLGRDSGRMARGAGVPSRHRHRLIKDRPLLFDGEDVYEPGERIC